MGSPAIFYGDEIYTLVSCSALEASLKFSSSICFTNRCPHPPPHACKDIAVTTPQNQPSRRTIVKGVAWSVPTLALAAAAPSFAISGPCAGICYTMTWPTSLLGKPANGQVILASPKDPKCTQGAAVTTSVTMTGTGTTVNSTTAFNSTGLYNTRFNGVIDYRGEQAGYYGSGAFPIAGVSASSPGLVLNIGTGTTTSVTFTFPKAVTSASLQIYDITRSINTVSGNSYRYQDTVSFSQPVSVSGTMTSANASTLAAGATFYRTGKYESTTTPIVNTFTTRSTTSFTSFTVNYTAPVSQGWQFIALGPLTFCY